MRLKETTETKLYASIDMGELKKKWARVSRPTKKLLSCGHDTHAYTLYIYAECSTREQNDIE